MAGVWTNNWRGVKNAMLIGAFVPGLSTVQGQNGQAITHLGTGDFVLSPMGGHVGWHAQPEYRGFGASVALGDGTDVVPAVTDCTLGHFPSISYLSVASDDLSVDTVNGRCSRHYSIHIKNAGSTAVTLTEWGVFTTPAWQKIDASANYCRYTLGDALVYHATLDSPIVLAAGESSAVELTLTLTLDDPI